MAFEEDYDFHWDFSLEGTKIPPKPTLYYDTLHKLPEFDEPLQLIGFEVILHPDTEKHVHHLGMAICNTKVDDEMYQKYQDGYELATVDEEGKMEGGQITEINSNCTVP